MLQQAVKLKQMKKQKASARKQGRVSKEQENIKKEANRKFRAEKSTITRAVSSVGRIQRQRKEEMEQDQNRISTKQRRAASFHHQHFIFNRTWR